MLPWLIGGGIVVIAIIIVVLLEVCIIDFDDSEDKDS